MWLDFLCKYSLYVCGASYIFLWCCHCQNTFEAFGTAFWPPCLIQQELSLYLLNESITNMYKKLNLVAWYEYFLLDSKECFLTFRSYLIDNTCLSLDNCGTLKKKNKYPFIPRHGIDHRWRLLNVHATAWKGTSQKGNLDKFQLMVEFLEEVYGLLWWIL